MREDMVQQYRTIHEQKPGYGKSAYWAPIVSAYAKRVGGTSILDFGTGKGAMVDALQLANPSFHVVGYDPAVPGFDDESVIHTANRYDVVTSIDVLEHCPPGTIKPELVKLRDLAAFGVFLVISCRPATQLLPDGRNAHLSVHPPEWWEDRIDEVFAPTIWERYRHGWNEKNRALSIWISARDQPRAADRIEMLTPEFLGLDEGSKRIAVVGNGPVSVEDLDEIEHADIVIRFNDWNRRRDYSPASTGARCDFLFTQFDSNHDPEKIDGGAPNRICIAIPSPFKQDQIIEKCDLWFPNERIAMFNPYTMRRICRDVLRLRDSPGYQHPIPTVGFQMLFWLHQSCPRVHDIFVTGFTWHVDPETETVAKCDALGDVFPQGYNHSYLREVRWCAANLVEDPIFTFGKLTKDALYWFRWRTTDQKFEREFHAGKGGDWRYDEKRWMVGKTQLQQFIDLLPYADRVLDLGSGPRSMVEYLEVQPRERWVCIDPLMDEYHAMGKAQFPSLEGLRTIASPAEQLLDDLKGQFTLVWCHNVLDHCYDPAAVIRNIWHYLARGGVAYIATDVHPPKKGHLGIDLDLPVEFAALGFRVKHFHLKKEKTEGVFVRDQTYIVEKP